ncbi:MAG TPA: metallophosphoesterase [Steroidobacteraceae bacterium]|nr:metallophosphoesterase [Steroidobacteraceae bacterium]
MRRGLLLLSAAFVVGMAAQSWAGVVAYAAGDIAQCHGDPQKSAAARTAQMIPPDAVVFVVGDTAYPFADRATLESCYAPTWDRFLAHTYAVPGNHDYIQGSARDFLDYFGARTPRRTWFRELVGDWWVIGLDSNIGGATLIEQQAWLDEQLQAIKGDGRCVLAMWHHPVLSTGLHRNDGARMRPAWDALDRAGADLILNGHEHFYESFEPRDESGRRVSVGMREIIAGTGGAHLYDLSLGKGYKTYVRVHGLLELHLDKDRYSYAFRTLDGRIRDAGSAQCRRSNHSPS